MPGLKDINQLRSVSNWATTYLWDIQFFNPAFSSGAVSKGVSSCPYPFNDWFPASSVTEPLFNVETQRIDGHVISLEIPKSTGALQIRLEFFDSSNHVLEKWLKEWFQSIFPGYLEVTPLYDAVKILEVKRLTPGKKEIWTNRYYVFPKGNVEVDNNSQSAIKKISVTLAVAGMETVSRGVSPTV